MKKIVFSVILLLLLSMPVMAKEFTAETIPDEAESYVIENPMNFWDDLRRVILDAFIVLKPDVAEAMKTCIRVISVVLLGGILSQCTSSTFVARLVVAISAGLLLLNSGQSLIELGRSTVLEISDYGKLLLPVLTGSLAAQGAVTTSTALYTGTVLFSALLSTAVSRLLIPVLYIFLCVCIGYSVLVNESLKRIRTFLKWLLTWALKIILYLFTGYMSISGVISGTVDASALKATKLAISSAVPVVGNILSDASETILLGAGMMKNSVGLYGIVVMATILIGPFLKIGLHYILTKLTAAVCSLFGGKEVSELIDDYSSAMGYVLAMTGVSCVLLMIGIVCMMKGVG